MLQAALQPGNIPASAGEAFFTGGGVRHVREFQKSWEAGRELHREPVAFQIR